MIKIRKGEIPNWLIENQVNKTIEYKDAPSDKKPSPWRAKEIVQALKAECFKKCMYCEAFIDDVTYSAVEHIKPKRLFEDLVLEWRNLGLVCTRCNTNKGAYWSADESLQILNPYEDDLSEHIEFHGPLTSAKVNSRRGWVSIKKLKLYERSDLLVSRVRQIESLEDKIRLWDEETNPELKQLFAEDIHEAIADNQEFSGVLRSHAVRVGFPVD